MPTQFSFNQTNGNVVSVKDYGTITGTDATADTAVIQAAYDAAVALGEPATVEFSQGQTYAVNQVTVNSDYDLTTIAHGAEFRLHFSGGAAFTFRGSNAQSFGSRHQWWGGMVRPSSTAASHLPRMFDFTQTTNYDVCQGHTVAYVRAQDVYQFAHFDMDKTTYPSGSNFRHTLIGCVSEVRTNLAAAWPGGYGVKFGGTTANDSAGNDSRMIDCKFLNHRYGVITNGSRTTFSMGSIDGANCTGIYLDGAANFTLLNSYLEYLDYTFEYANSPTDPFVIGNQLPVTFSTGTLGAGNFSKALQVANTGVTQNELNALTCNSNTGNALEGITATGSALNLNVTGAGKAATIEDNGTEVGSIEAEATGMELIGATEIFLNTPLLRPTTADIGNIGSASALFNKAQFNQYNLKDGITAPGTVAGLAQLYVDSADGDLKVKFGDGTVKTIATDT